MEVIRSFSLQRIFQKYHSEVSLPTLSTCCYQRLYDRIKFKTAILWNKKPAKKKCHFYLLLFKLCFSKSYYSKFACKKAEVFFLQFPYRKLIFWTTGSQKIRYALKIDLCSEAMKSFLDSEYIFIFISDSNGAIKN